MDLLLSTTRPYIKPGTNGATIPIYKARGMALRKMSYDAAIGLGVKLKLGEACTSFYTTEQVLDLLPVIVTAKELENAVAQRKRELKAAARNGNGAGNGNGYGNGETPAPIAIAEAPVEVEDVEVVDATLPATATNTETEVITLVSDTPEVRVPLRRLAASVGCSIVQLDEETISVFDCGPYALIDDTSGDRVWPCGLPLAGILDALHRFAHERHLPADQKGEAWIGFGLAWRK